MLTHKIQQNIVLNFPEMRSAKLLLAVSGGIDSMVMLDVLLKLGYDITVAHCNFKLRGDESEAETLFLKHYLEQKNISHHIIYFDTEDYAEKNKLSIQLAARELRYDWFEKLLKSEKLDFLITAHHLDDHVETFLINLTRGTGIEGLLGMPAKNNTILRPFLIASREEILEYATQNSVEWRDDSSNASTKYFRNKLRHKVIPILKELNPDFLQSFSDTVSHLHQYQQGFQDGFELIKKEVITIQNNQIIFDVCKLKQLQNPASFLYNFLKDYGFTAWKDIYALIDAQAGKKVLTTRYTLLKDREQLILKENTEQLQTTFFIDSETNFNKLPIRLAVQTTFDANHMDAKRIILDKEKLNFPLKLRKWEEGDYFYPFGMNGKKKLSKYFKDEKLSIFQKQEVWLLTQNNNDIIWVIGYRADNRFVSNKTTINTLQIELLE